MLADPWLKGAFDLLITCFVGQKGTPKFTDLQRIINAIKTAGLLSRIIYGYIR